MNLTKEQSDKYIEIVKNGNMDDMFDFGVSVSLKKMVGLYGTPNCDNLHHNKKQQHEGYEICPVVKEINSLLTSHYQINTDI